MKKLLLTFIILGIALTTNAQTQTKANAPKASVERSLFSIQTGFLGIWINNEARLSNSFVLRSELGFAAQIWGGSYQKTGFLMTPVVRLEPRWYYNLRKRKAKGKRIDGNSGNFISLQTSYYPGGLAISNYDDVEISPVFTLSPMWGIQRNIGHHFNYEVAVGMGYSHYFPDKNGYGESDNLSLDLLLRIGYRF
ncbi:MAG TPA: hypothetical protein ENH53_08750 [Bacteroidetes bacterium]|nr:hypothetical protein [Bacteroidota bacterium]